MTLQQEKKTINNWMILYTRGDAFNGWFPIGNGIREGSNGKGGQYFEWLPIMVIVWLDNLSKIGDFNFDSELDSNFGCDLDFDCNYDFNCNLDFDFNGNLH